MVGRIKRVFITTLLVSTSAWGAESAPSLSDVPVVDTMLVAPASYGGASSLAKKGRDVLAIALAVAGRFEGSAQHIIQVNAGSEAPAESRVTVIRDGLLDDSVRGERWDIKFQRTATGQWRISEVMRAWRCWRGPGADRFSATRCP